MPTIPSPVPAILASGAVASLLSAATLLVTRHVEGEGAFQPLNATSHWFCGERVAERETADLHRDAEVMRDQGGPTSAIDLQPARLDEVPDL